MRLLGALSPAATSSKSQAVGNSPTRLPRPTACISSQLLTTPVAWHQPRPTREACRCKTIGLHIRGIRTSPDPDSSNSLSLRLQETRLHVPCHRQRGQYPSEVSPPPLFHTSPHGHPTRGPARPQGLEGHAWISVGVCWRLLFLTTQDLGYGPRKEWASQKNIVSEGP